MNPLAKACWLLDVEVLTDIEQAPNGQLIGVYRLGVAAEPGAGINGFDVSPCFASESTLAAWCAEHMSKIEEVAKYIDNNEAWPDTLPWCCHP